MGSETHNCIQYYVKPTDDSENGFHIVWSTDESKQNWPDDKSNFTYCFFRGTKRKPWHYTSELHRYCILSEVDLNCPSVKMNLHNV